MCFLIDFFIIVSQQPSPVSMAPSTDPGLAVYVTAQAWTRLHRPSEVDRFVELVRLKMICKDLSSGDTPVGELVVPGAPLSWL